MCQFAAVHHTELGQKRSIDRQTEGMCHFNWFLSLLLFVAMNKPSTLNPFLPILAVHRWTGKGNRDSKLERYFTFLFFIF